MNIFHKVTLKTLHKNRTRTLVTIIGIILSAAMFTAVTTFISSLQMFMLNVSIHETGDWYGSLYATNGTKISNLKANSETTTVAVSQNIGYAILEDIINEDKPYLHILGVDKTFTETMPIHLISGRMPENHEEILLPKHLSTNGGVNNNMGDVLSLELGDRTLDQRTLNQFDPYSDVRQDDPNIIEEQEKKEELVIRETRKYTVVGFYERPSFETYSAPGYTAVTLMDDGDLDSSYNAYFKLEDPKRIYDFLSEQTADGEVGVNFTNNDVLLYKGTSRYDSFFRVLYSLAAILMGIIMFGSISLIYNAFAISVSERTKQFGLLSSVGATKKQIKNSVLFEALYVSAIGIPLGILSGILGIGVTLAFVGRFFSDLYRGDVNIPFSVHVNLWSVAIAAAVAMVTVLISAWIPSRRVAKISAIDAIRRAGDISVKGKTVKTSKLVYKFFGLEGMIARKHFKRSKRRYRATVISLFMSIVLFISASSFSAYLKDSVEGVFEQKSFDISYSIYDDDRLGGRSVQDIYKVLKNVQGVTDSVYTYMKSCEVEVPLEYLTEEFKKAYPTNQGMAMFYAVDDESWSEFLAEHGLDEKLFTNEDAPMGIALSHAEGFNYEKQIYENFEVFSGDRAEFTLKVFNNEQYNKLTQKEKDTLKDYDPFYVQVPVKAGAVVEEMPIGIDGNYSGATVTIMYPESLMDTVSPMMREQQLMMYFTVDNHSVVYDKMIEALNQNNMSAVGLYDYASMSETERNLMLILNVFSYGFIVLISLIAVANVFNTISTNISLRRREFAMLKSVGMTQKGFNKMMNFECLLYGIKSLVWGLPASMGVTYLIYRGVSEGYTTNFYVPWLSIVIAVCSVFVVVFSTMMYAMSKIRKENPIDALRNENL